MAAATFAFSESTQAFIDEQVAAGRFASANEFVENLVEQARQSAARNEFEGMLLTGLHSSGGEEVTPGYWEGLKEEWGKKYRGESAS